MSTYNAFISYRHCPKDSAVAAEIQKQLERFHIPSAIRKASGIKKLTRIFRDQEELALTEDLNETIRHALDQSEFLILICSPEMKRSIWVQKEIAYFLIHHSKKQILTVIADGEPEAVLPEVLLYDEFISVDASGEECRGKIRVEPLSCDYRMSFRQARKQELPRLVATLIGCGYDDLRRRQRQYRMRRLFALFVSTAVILLGLSVYFAWSAAQIRDNYEQSLINQSEYLSAEARSLLTEGDRLSSVQLALHALPDEGNERPVVPGAIDALVRATYAYVPPGQETFRLDRSVAVEGRIDLFSVDPSESYLLLTYDTSNYALWDLRRDCMLLQKQLSEYIFAAEFTPQSNLLLLTEGRLLCLEPETGSVIWEYCPTDGMSFQHFCCMPGGNLALYHSSLLQIIDSEEGTLLKEITLPSEYSGLKIQEVQFSPDNSHLVIYESNLADQILLCDMSTGLFQLFSLPEGYLRHLTFAPNGDLYIASSNNSFSYFVNDEVSLYEKDTGKLYRITSMGDILWESDLESYHASVCEAFYFHVTDDGIEQLIYCFSNLCYLFDAVTGDLVCRTEFLSSLLTVQKTELGVRALLTNGELAECNPSSGVVQSTSGFASGDSAAYLGKDIYIPDPASGKVLIYRSNVYDDTWEACYTVLQASTYLSLDQGILIGQDDFTLSFLASSNRSIRWSTTTDIKPYGMISLGTTDHGQTAVLYFSGRDLADSYRNALCFVDLSNGSQNYHYFDSIPQKELICFNGDRVYYVEYTDLTYRLMSLDVCSQTVEALSVLWDDFVPATLCVSPDGNTAFIWDRMGKCLLWQNGSLSVLQDAYSADFVSYTTLFDASWSEDGTSFAITSRDSIDLYRSSMELVASIPKPVNGLVGFDFYSDYLLVIGQSRLYFYDLQGNYIAETGIIGESTPVECKLTPVEEDKLALLVGKQLTLIDMHFFQAYTTVENCLNYTALEDCFFVLDYQIDNTVIGCFDAYSLQELMQRAKEQLNGLELTQEQKIQYGLS